MWFLRQASSWQVLYFAIADQGFSLIQVSSNDSCNGLGASVDTPRNVQQKTPLKIGGALQVCCFYDRLKVGRHPTFAIANQGFSLIQVSFIDNCNGLGASVDTPRNMQQKTP